MGDTRSSMRAGARCEVNVDDCVTTDGRDPCTRNGLCVDGVAEYSCLCGPGWVGEHCQLPIDDCACNKILLAYHPVAGF